MTRDASLKGSSTGTTTQAATAVGQDIEIKGRMLMISVVRLADEPLDSLVASFRRKLTQSPDWLASVPLLLDLDGWSDRRAERIAATVGALRELGLRILGIREHEGIEAPEAPLALIPLASGGAVRPVGDADAATPRPRKTSEVPARDDAAPPPAAGCAPTRVLHQTVRSGQQVYARGGDLIVFGSVSDGAEILADGNIHVHGSLRGRAIAGARGDADAVLYARQFAPQLVSIAGHYRTAEDLAEDSGGERFVRLEGESLAVRSAPV